MAGQRNGLSLQIHQIARTIPCGALIFGCVLSLLIAQQCFSEATAQVAAKQAESTVTAKELANRVDAHYNKLRSLSVGFTERYRGMGIDRSESGTLLLAKPGRMRWNYTQPAGKLFVTDGRYAYAYTPGDAQAERFRAKQLNDFRSPLQFLLGHARIAKEMNHLTIAKEGADYRLRGIPVGMEDTVSRVELTVNAEGKISSIYWQEKDGATTDFRLQEEHANPHLPSGTFSFQPPAGVVVVNGLAPI